MKMILPLLFSLMLLTLVGLNIGNPTDPRPATAVGGLPAEFDTTTPMAMVSSSKTACSAVVGARHRAAVDAVAKKVIAAVLTMTSPERMANSEFCALDAIERGLEGDFVETGVWRGGVSMVMRKAALLTKTDACHESWLFDSYEGLPAENKMDELHSAAWKGQEHSTMDEKGSYAFEGGVETVKRDVEKFVGGNSDTIHFVKGWFQDTVFKAPISKISVLRLDGDMYSSTMDVLHAFYDKVVPTGYVIIDDYGHWPQCKAAIHDYFDKEKKMNITALLKKVDYTGSYFQKPA
jgi:hypothetical protein